MKNLRNLFVCLFVVCSLKAIAQSENFIQLSGGLSLAAGDLISNGASNTGYSVSALFQSKMPRKKHLGFVAMVRTQSFKIDPARFTTGGGIMSSTSYDISSLLVGAMWSFELNKNIYFEPRAMIGAAISQSPSITGTPGNYIYITNSATDTAPALALGTNFRFDVTKRVSMFMNFDYFITRPKFQSTSYILPDYNAPPWIIPSTEYHSSVQQLDSFNFSVGIGYRF